MLVVKCLHSVSWWDACGLFPWRERKACGSASQGRQTVTATFRESAVLHGILTSRSRALDAATNLSVRPDSYQNRTTLSGTVTLPLCSRIEFHCVTSFTSDEQRPSQGPFQRWLLTDRIRQTACTSGESDEMPPTLSLFDALTQLNCCLAGSRSLHLFCQMDETFFRALACSLLGSDPDPSVQTATADLARDICAALSRSLRKMPKPSGISSSVYRSFEALTRHLVLPLLVAVSSPGLDSLVPSSAWALTYLLRATDSLRNLSPMPEPSLCRWPQRLMLLEHLLDALEVQFRCLSRLTHSLRRPNNSTSAEDVEDLNFDALFPLFSLLAQSPLDLTLRETTCTQLHSILKQFIDFLTAFTVYLPTKSGAGFFYHCLQTLLDSTLLPVSHQFLCALHHITSHDRGCIVTPDLLTHLGALAEALSDLGASSSAQAHITACLTEIFAVFCLSSSAPWQATLSAGERHRLFVDFLFTLLVTLKRRICWSHYCSDLLILLTKTLQSSVPLSLDEPALSTLLEQCLLTVRGPASREVCLALVSLLSSQQETRIPFGILAGTLDWLDSIIRLYILPVGVPVFDNPGVWDQFHVDLSHSCLTILEIINKISLCNGYQMDLLKSDSFVLLSRICSHICPQEDSNLIDELRRLSS
ncbi:hypothetical protein AAHC03_012928 [Spirometra sp. Aus1]